MSIESPHPTFDRVFRKGKLSLGIVLPMMQRPGDTTDPVEQFGYAALADRLGFAALWIRDVPLNGAGYPDPVGHLEPWVHLGALAAHTRSIALITGAIVAPLRHPLHVAKAAMSVDVVSNGRFILGLGTGDRQEEFGAFEKEHAQRAVIYREHWDRVAGALGSAPRFTSDGSGEKFEMRPRPVHGDLPMLVVGSSQQTLEWIARHSRGWVTYHRPRQVQQGRFDLWKNAVERVGDLPFRSFSESFALRLSEDRGAAPEPIELGYKLGSRALVDMLEQHREMGSSHIMFNFSGIRRPVPEVLEELARDVLPHFHGD